jgi:ferric-dicitrate binding protein FerR (iron transport regulator)
LSIGDNFVLHFSVLEPMEENKYLLLLIKRCQGDITPTELSILNGWIKESSENERLAQEYTLIWSKSGEYTRDFVLQLDEDYAKVQARIQSTTPAPLLIRRPIHRIGQVAAGLTFLVMSFWGYRHFSTDVYYDTAISTVSTEKQQVQLSDGTQVWLRKGSALQYAALYDGKDDRRVKLSGEAYFEVSHDPKHPFRVELESGDAVEVLGTQFSVCQSADLTTILVRSGKVKFSPANQSETPILQAHQKAVFDHKNGTLTVSGISSFNEMAWQTEALEFVNTPLKRVVVDLENYYQVKITLQNPLLADCPHNALHVHQPLKNVLEGLAVAYQLQVNEIAPGVYHLVGGQCH